MKEIDPKNIEFYTKDGTSLIKFKEPVHARTELLAQYCLAKVEQHFPHLEHDAKKEAVAKEYKAAMEKFFGKI